MNIILLSGGSGKRLWPLSNGIRSKQFIPFFRNENGVYESMVQRIYGFIKEIDKDAKVVVATSKSQASELKNQLGDNISISIEPTRKDTFPAIALACAYLKDVLGASNDEGVVVCPVDPYVDKNYFDSLKQLCLLAIKSDYNLSYLGIKPTYPSEKYGYIIPASNSKISEVKKFIEKPDSENAKKLIEEEGALWNAGVFAFKLGYLDKKSHELIVFKDYYDLFDKYESLDKISFDYAVAEKEKNAQVMSFDGMWEDLGTWSTLTDVLRETSIGNVFLKNCKNVRTINELDIPVLICGIEDAIVALSPEGVLVSSIEKSAGIKPLAEQIGDGTVRFAEKSWGKYKVVDLSENSLTIKITLNSGHGMSYHSHDRRDEIWTIVSGKGQVIIDGIHQSVKPGDVISMSAGTRHTLLAETDMVLIEVQIGKDISVLDKTKYEKE